MESIQNFLRHIAAEIVKKERVIYEPEEVRVYFSAPDRASTETVTEEGNFQWVRYELLFKKMTFVNTGLTEVKHYIYKTPLFSWGSEAPGGQVVIDADPDISESDITPAEAKEKIIWRGRKILKKPDIYPVGLKGTYINTHPSASGREYTYDAFNKKFRQSGFYWVVTKSKKLESP